MSFLLQPLQIVLALLSESIRKEQEKVIEYLQLENQILLENLGRNRVLLSDDQRRLLAVKGNILGRKQLEKIATIAHADTILRWHRKLTETNCSSVNQKIGRPSTDKELVELVLHMARENVSWGYKRIEGALHNLGYRICSSTVANILKLHGIEPAPQRKRQLGWSTFLRAHLDVLEGVDFHATFSRLKGIFSLLPTFAGILWRAWSDSETPSTNEQHRCVDDIATCRFLLPDNTEVRGKRFEMDCNCPHQRSRPPPIFSAGLEPTHSRTGRRAA